jgi:hypothetical protein
MDPFESIEIKLHQFTRKYYTSELIKGGILFFSLGLLYLFFTLFLESFLWLKPSARTVLFYLFIGVELFLLIRLIAFPFMKLIGLQNGITDTQSSKIIGRHFPEVQDKLLNVLQLKKTPVQSDLLLASIDQKSKELEFVSFTKAVDFKYNKRYLKVAIFPLLIWAVIFFTNYKPLFKESLERVVNYKTTYTPPPAFSFYLSNPNLEVIQGKSLSIQANTKGTEIPEEALIHFEGQQYYLNNTKGGFSYVFNNVQQSFSFYITAKGIRSQYYKVNIINTPTINNVTLELRYPAYLAKQNEIIDNSGTITVPEGTKINWKVDASQTDSMAFITPPHKKVFFKAVSKNLFSYSKTINKELNYQITSSNKLLKNFDVLSFKVDVIKDESPLISVETNTADISRGASNFAGQVSDDYGISNLEVVLYEEESPQNKQQVSLQITDSNIQTFFYQFPDGFTLQNGTNYQFFFQVFDNDAVNGCKKATSQMFYFRKKTLQEVRQEMLQEQRNTILNIEGVVKDQQDYQKELLQIQKELQVKKKLKWSDKKRLQKLVQRQQKHTQKIQRQTKVLQESLGENKEENQYLQNKKNTLQQRLKEIQKSQKEQRLLDEINKIADKINKSDFLKKAKELAQRNHQQERSLTRILELTKRFYIEQKTMQIADIIEKLSLKQKKAILKNDSISTTQNEIKEGFKRVKEGLKELEKDNQDLKEPLALPNLEDNKEKVDTALQNVQNKLLKKTPSKAKTHQQNVSKELKKMSVKMRQAMKDMQGVMMEENIEELRNILENLLVFSFKQEQLMNTFVDKSTNHPNFGEDLKKQHQLKTYFEHIDDSLYVLSMRLPMISTSIQNDLSSTHYNLDQSLDNFSEDKFSRGVSNQRYVMLAVNNLANYLSNTLDNTKNSMSMKPGSGGKQKESRFRLPDLIKTQGELSKKISKGIKKGQRQGKDTPGNKTKKTKEGAGLKKGESGKRSKEATNEDSDGELYEIYKQQSLLRQELQAQLKALQNKGQGIKDATRKALQKMQDLENQILEKGFHFSTLQKMQQLSYELLKLDNALLKQGTDNKRISNTASTPVQKKKPKAIQFKKPFYNRTEILNRQSLPLRQNYKKKVRAYFSETKKQ